MTDVRATQAPVEVIRDAQTVDVRATQFAVEVIRSVDFVSSEIVVSDTLNIELIESGLAQFEVAASDTIDISFTESGSITIPGAAGPRRPTFFIITD